MLSVLRPKPILSLLPVRYSKLLLSSFSSIAALSRNEETLMCLLKKCSNVKDFRQIHAHIIQSGFDQSLFLVGKLVVFCAVSQHGEMEYATSVFETLQNPDGFIWNSMIRGFAKTRHPQKAFEYYKRMQETGEVADSFTFSFLLKACGQVGSVVLGKQMLCGVLKHGLETNVFVRNTLIHMYGMFRDIQTANKLFEEMPNRDLVAWNAIIDCHVTCGECKEALQLFLRMLEGGIEPDEATLVVIISACSALGALGFGRWVHSSLGQTSLGEVVDVNNALIDMYAKCGAYEEAYKIFNEMNGKTLVTWNTMILALATHGKANEALRLFSNMLDENIATPDGVTFLGVLSACSHGGLVDEGRYYFDIMREKYHIEPTIKHSGCMVDILGRAGLVEEAYQLIMSMPMECNSIVGRALLAACRVHGDVEVGEKITKHLLELEPNHSSDYVLLANMYAGAGKWNEMVEVRKLMHDRGVEKPEPGNSFIDISTR